MSRPASRRKCAARGSSRRTTPRTKRTHGHTHAHDARQHTHTQPRAKRPAAPRCRTQPFLPATQPTTTRDKADMPLDSEGPFETHDSAGLPQPKVRPGASAPLLSTSPCAGGAQGLSPDPPHRTARNVQESSTHFFAARLPTKMQSLPTPIMVPLASCNDRSQPRDRQALSPPLGQRSSNLTTRREPLTTIIPRHRPPPTNPAPNAQAPPPTHKPSPHPKSAIPAVAAAAPHLAAAAVAAARPTQAAAAANRPSPPSLPSPSLPSPPCRAAAASRPCLDGRRTPAAEAGSPWAGHTRASGGTRAPPRSQVAGAGRRSSYAAAASAGSHAARHTASLQVAGPVAASAERRAMPRAAAAAPPAAASEGEAGPPAALAAAGHPSGAWGAAPRLQCPPLTRPAPTVRAVPGRPGRAAPLPAELRRPRRRPIQP
jgi:hypothetical protein